jgi:hypothetical protein
LIPSIEHHAPLPHEPQSLKQLQARFFFALSITYDTTDVISKNINFGIGQNRQHVFDCEDGLRIILSREREPRGLVFIHVSASWDPTCGFYRAIQQHAATLGDALKLVETRYREISGDSRAMRFLGITVPRGIPHFAIEETKP